ncbi:hypothetical protein [Vibrio agarivorans]|uniref:Uncharacterized protein n=1 Tax=Vibrio agarivorans TaxID=153622 RepID=A0ABT7Y780_9VIBR|nr:hypothetical protein [Vibrio agarivorans]MDN2483907.1 hypothetical protein [Vibrio agarivorans]
MSQFALSLLKDDFNSMKPNSLFVDYEGYRLFLSIASYGLVCNGEIDSSSSLKSLLNDSGVIEHLERDPVTFRILKDRKTLFGRFHIDRAFHVAQNQYTSRISCLEWYEVDSLTTYLDQLHDFEKMMSGSITDGLPVSSVWVTAAILCYVVGLVAF